MIYTPCITNSNGHASWNISHNFNSMTFPYRCKMSAHFSSQITSSVLLMDSVYCFSNGFLNCLSHISVTMTLETYIASAARGQYYYQGTNWVKAVGAEKRSCDSCHKGAIGTVYKASL